MISRRSNYNYLLDILKYTYENFDISEEGIVFNKNMQEEQENRTVINRRFCEIYSKAYQFAKGIETMGSTKDKQWYNNLALSDYNTFNSFINNCVNECRMYNNVGTGTILYIPFEELANYIFKNDISKEVLVEYLNCELEKVITYNKDKQKVK